MHEAFTLSPTLPVPPGEGPFHVKGIYYTRTVAHASQQVKGGLPALLDAIDDPKVRAFLQQKFSWNNWYDVFPIMPVSIALAKVRGQDYMELFHERGRLAAKEEIPRVFRMLLSFASIRMQLQQLPLFASSMYDFGAVEDLRGTETTTTGRHRGIPAYVAPYVAATISGFLRGTLELRTKRPASVRIATVTRDADQKGFPTVSVRYEGSY
jgi:hypothetical protein